MDRQATTMDLQKKLQAFTEKIQKIIKMVENSTGKRPVRDTATAALLSAILQGEYDGLWDHIPELRAEWRIYQEKVAHTAIHVDITAYLAPPTYPDVASAELLSLNGGRSSNAGDVISAKHHAHIAAISDS
ncbi:hypothetical protein RUND412_008220 [Rhizina undulata]